MAHASQKRAVKSQSKPLLHAVELTRLGPIPDISTLKILWAVDVFDPEPLLWRHQEDFLSSLIEMAQAARKEVKITPVHVLSPEQLELQLEFSKPWLDRYVPAAQKALDERMRKTRIPQNAMNEGKILVHTHASTRGSVQTLMSFAATESYDWIVVASHGRRGLQRALMGSFAEALMLRSRIPVLVVGAEATPTAHERFKEILFATDLSPESHTALKKLLPAAKLLGSRIRLYHAVVRPMEPVIQGGLLLASGAWVGVPEFLKLEYDRRRSELREWMESVQAQGIPCTFDIEESVDALPHRIIEMAREHGASMIAIAGQSGGFSAALLGSIARDVVRHASCPVWVLHESHQGT